MTRDDQKTTHARRSSAAAAERVYDRHVATLEKLGLDDVAETTIDLRKRLRESA